MENCKYGKQIGKILDIKNKQKHHQAQKPILLGLESEKYENKIQNFENLGNLQNLTKVAPEDLFWTPR